MRDAVRWRSALLLALALGLAGGLPPTAHAQAKDESQRWVPALSAYGGVLVQNAKADVSSGLVTGNRIGSSTQPIRPSASGSELQVTPFVGGSVELMTPALIDAPGRPRLFVHGDVVPSFAFSRDIAKEGVPGTLAPTPGLTGLINEATVAGQGSKTTAEVQSPQFSAGAGVAFTFEAWERRFRIKPSVEWIREEIEVTGVVSRAVQTVVAPLAPNFPQGFRLITLSGSETETYDGIGPGLEFEADAARAGPLFLTVYLAGQAYHFLGDLEVEFEDSQIPPCTSASLCSAFPGQPAPESATWSFEKDRWAFRAGVGLRFRWLPE